ncbi:transposase, partial [Candidatus Falkowbacteria bacterium]|nr:transposase [Candidatus Falkowbacteria bacterium]
SKFAYEEVKERFPFNIACINTDNGGENEKNFKEQTDKDNILRFYTRAGTPTDNPRVERSHLTDEIEFYKRGNKYRKFKEQKQALNKWEYIYNYIRPHQALGNLTPMEFYKLWKKDPEKAHKIKDKYQAYLIKQGKRLARSRRIKKKEQIETLMKFIDVKLNQKNKQKIDLKPYKLELTKCELCSWT